MDIKEKERKWLEKKEKGKDARQTAELRKNEKKRKDR